MEVLELNSSIAVTCCWMAQAITAEYTPATLLPYVPKREQRRVSARKTGKMGHTLIRF
jgi:hypothetical protein